MSQATLNGHPESQESAGEGDASQPKIGTLFTVNRLWESRTPEDRLIWLTEPPQSEPDKKPVSESPEHAITLLHRDFKKTVPYRLDTIILRGPELSAFLEETVPNIATHYSESEHGFAIRAPFRMLYWYLDQIDAAIQGPNKKLGEILSLLQGVLKEQFRDIVAKKKELLARQEMNFGTLWTLLQPETTCITYYVGYTVAGKISSVDVGFDASGNMYYKIQYRMLGWDGESLGWQHEKVDIMEFAGRQKIRDLDIFPIKYHEDPNIAHTLAARGRRFVGTVMKEPHMMSFNGEGLDREISPLWWESEQKKKMADRVALDARAYSHYFRRLAITRWLNRDEMKALLTKEDADETAFLYVCSECHCFALQRKKWTRVWIDDLDDVVFNDSAYPSLVLPHDYKELLLSFAEAQIDGVGFDDVIAGKGQGILMLLAGPPGTGKTLTAEALAEHMKRPLYSVSAGELGNSVGGMENELDRVLELTTRWNAVLLLDEADVFLQKRTDNDLQRNTVVSVFLRKLEYYRGIMFLTTNRIASFDEAFKSRIHVAIRYPDLDSASRRLIWQNFLNKAQEIYHYGVNVSPQQLDEISQKTLNGREIRNIIKSAQLLASRSKVPVQISHLETVWRVEHEDSPWGKVDGAF